VLRYFVTDTKLIYKSLLYSSFVKDKWRYFCLFNFYNLKLQSN